MGFYFCAYCLFYSFGGFTSVLIVYFNILGLNCISLICAFLNTYTMPLDNVIPLSLKAHPVLRIIE